MSDDRVPSVVIPLPARENVRAKARRFVLEGRIRIRVVHRGRVYAEVRGDTGTVHAVVFTKGRWGCSCENTTKNCSHLNAVWLVVATNDV